jgi:hypothetical protein
LLPFRSWWQLLRQDLLRLRPFHLLMLLLLLPLLLLLLPLLLLLLLLLLYPSSQIWLNRCCGQRLRFILSRWWLRHRADAGV